MSARTRILAIVVLGAFLTNCTSGSAEIGEIESVDYVEADLTRWAHLPYASLPPPRFIRATEEWRYNPSGGAPILHATTEREIAAVNRSFSTMRVKTSGQSRQTTNMFRSYMGFHNMGSSYSGSWGQDTRRVLDVVPGRNLPLSPVVKSRFPELQGVRAADLSHDFTWKIRIGQGGGSERWFKVSSQVTNIEPVRVTVNGEEYMIDAYLIDYSITNQQGIYKSEMKLWYVPILGWDAQYVMRSESRRGIWRSASDNTSFEVTEEVLAEFKNYAKLAR